MKTKITLIAMALVFALSSCQKDLAVEWAGTYTGISGSTFSRVVITKIDKKTVKLDLQTSYLTSYVTYATIAHGNLSSATNLSVNEDGSILGYSDPYHFTGVGSLNGNTLTLSGQAQNKNNASDIKTYTFTGSK